MKLFRGHHKEKYDFNIDQSKHNEILNRWINKEYSQTIATKKDEFFDSWKMILIILGINALIIGVISIVAATAGFQFIVFAILILVDFVTTLVLMVMRSSAHKNVLAANSFVWNVDIWSIACQKLESTFSNLKFDYTDRESFPYSKVEGTFLTDKTWIRGRYNDKSFILLQTDYIRFYWKTVTRGYGKNSYKEKILVSETFYENHLDFIELNHNTNIMLNLRNQRAGKTMVQKLTMKEAKSQKGDNALDHAEFNEWFEVKGDPVEIRRLLNATEQEMLTDYYTENRTVKGFTFKSAILAPGVLRIIFSANSIVPSAIGYRTFEGNKKIAAKSENSAQNWVNELVSQLDHFNWVLTHAITPATMLRKLEIRPIDI